MKSQMNNSSCSTGNGERAKDEARYSTIDSTGNHGDLREINNQGDLRDMTDRSGSKNRISMTDS
jgi:hypothetical protein